LYSWGIPNREDTYVPEISLGKEKAKVECERHSLEKIEFYSQNQMSVQSNHRITLGLIVRLMNNADPV
jgi:hypothetical protein